jgi:hypothetical protein
MMGALARAVAVPITARCVAQHHEKVSPAAATCATGEISKTLFSLAR